MRDSAHALTQPREVLSGARRRKGIPESADCDEFRNGRLHAPRGVKPRDQRTPPILRELSRAHTFSTKYFGLSRVNRATYQHLSGLRRPRRQIEKDSWSDGLIKSKHLTRAKTRDARGAEGHRARALSRSGGASPAISFATTSSSLCSSRVSSLSRAATSRP